MNTKTKIFLDKTIAKFLIILLNNFVRLVGKLLRIDHSLNKEFKVIAIAKYKGLGSIIQATPLLLNLRQKYPQAQIIFISTKGNIEILSKIPCIDKIVTIDDKNLYTLIKTFFPFILRLIQLRIELLIDLEIYSNFSSLISTLTLGKNRLGFFLRSSNYRLGIYTHMMYYNIRVPISQTYLQFARLLNCENISENLYQLEGNESDLQIEKIGQLLKVKEYIVINPNASDLRIERRWDASNFIALIKALQIKYPDLTIVLIGGNNEVEYVHSIYSSLKNQNKILNLAGKTTINQLISLIKFSTLLITNDTGPMHIAFSLKTNTVALFGPCSPEQYGQNENCFAIYHKVYCSPCVHEFSIPPCGGNNQCMKLIQVNEVLQGVDLILTHQKNKIAVKSSDKSIYEVKNENGDLLTLGFIQRENQL